MITIEIEFDDHFFVTWRTGNEQVFAAAKRTFRALLPRHAARFDAGARAWVVDYQWRQRLRQFVDFMAANYAARIVDGCGFLDDEEDDSLAEAFAELCLLPTAAKHPQLIRQAYKLLATTFHPDKPGGDAERMRQINVSYERIMRSLSSEDKVKAA